MSKYYVDGYTVPEGVKSRDDVLAWQKKLGVTQDGIWGRKTQAAYDRYTGKNTGYAPEGFDYDATAERYRKSLEGILRPSVDAAIERRKKATDYERAEIDADAAARGIAASTYVTDVKKSAENAEQDDIESYETGYNQTLSQTLQSMITDAYKTYLQEKTAKEQLALEREKLRASQSQFKQNLALQKEKLQKQYADYDKSSIGRGYTRDDYFAYLFQLNYEDRVKAFTSDEPYWAFIREQMRADLTDKEYQNLEDIYTNRKLYIADDDEDIDDDYDENDYFFHVEQGIV